ncbi:MAG: serine hydrolase [Opitutaceae bacterium]|nr:serine hydrolase [Opitutaceae bacterium]
MCPRLPGLVASLLLGSLASHVALAAPRLPRATPESQGISSAAILAFVEAADMQVDSMNSLMLVRHGRVVAEGWWTPYTAADRHMLYSLSKSFTSTAVGLAAAEGRLSIDDPVLKFFPSDAPAERSENLENMRVRDLLIMSTGHHADAIAAFNAGAPGSAAARFLALPVEHKPGTHFVYNSPATFMQSAIVQSVTGQTVLDYLRPRLFEPLGIEDPAWEATPQGITLGMSGLSIRTEDIACFGQLLLQRGSWQGRQLVPAAWIDEATAKQTSNGSSPASDWDQGYGYQFWRCRPGFARADGAFGQFCFVMPQYDAVLAITSGTRDMQGVMNLVWEKVLPALGSTPLPEAPETHRTLTERLAGLSVRAPEAAATSILAAQFSGRTYVFPENERHIESLTLDTSGATPALIVRGAGHDGKPIAVGSGSWIRGRTTFGSDVEPGYRVLVERAVAAQGGWASPDTFVAKLCFYETPYAITVKLQFGGDLVVLDGSYNVSFGPNDLPQLIGRAGR